MLLTSFAFEHLPSCLTMHSSCSWVSVEVLQVADGSSWQPCSAVFSTHADRLGPSQTRHQVRLTSSMLCPRRWVEGELLQFAEGSPVTQGARLGFMWACPGQRRFLVSPLCCEERAA